MAHFIPERVKSRLALKANPDCDECNGDGWVTYTARNLHGEEEAVCACIERDEPEEDSDAWSGGFAENH